MFNDWNETKPGFMETDLVAHCGINTERSFLSTLTLTDIATGWTECLPLLSRSQETVVAALKRAQRGVQVIWQWNLPFFSILS
ncbi:MAG TPA: hypothetical protein VFV38_50975 [Ktedonobacteraceae bacterium]|nr:hypothetical protein [Ktedonobacteraceae bacterium]